MQVAWETLVEFSEIAEETQVALELGAASRLDAAISSQLWVRAASTKKRSSRRSISEPPLLSRHRNE
jgi:hypothetical protein